MKHITSTVVPAGARQSCAAPSEPLLPGMGSICQQPAFRPVLRREVMAAVNICGRDLGLRPAALVVLDTLLSCLPCQSPDRRDMPVAPTTLLTIYASNDTLCFRAKGITDRQLRRQLESLEAAGLILRRDSANGKRFPVMRQGKAIGAFGIDLSPLFARADDLLALAHRRREEIDELRGLRARILQLRGLCLDRPLGAAVTEFVEGLRNVLRRASLTLTEARALLTRLTDVLALAPHRETRPSEAGSDRSHKPMMGLSDGAIGEGADHVALHGPGSEQAPEETPQIATLQETGQTPASDGQNDRHKEHESDSKKSRPDEAHDSGWHQLTEVNAFYPQPATTQEARIIAFEFGRMLRISQDLLSQAVERLGLWGVLRFENRMAQQASTILNPDAYLRTILRS